jgi:hypothetical protein
MAEITIVAGTQNITPEALAHMRNHGATIEPLSIGLSLITLPESVELGHTPSLPGQYAIDWDGELEAEWIAIELDIDASRTWVTLRK